MTESNGWLDRRVLTTLLLVVGPAAFIGIAVFEAILGFILYLVGVIILVGGIGGAMLLAVPARKQAREANRSIDKERYAAMTWLTALDEAWLADRHFWAIPREVARLRGGQDWDREWTYGLGQTPREIEHRERMTERAERARNTFEGVNLTPDVERSEPLSGEVLDGQLYPRVKKTGPHGTASFDLGPRQEFGHGDW